MSRDDILLEAEMAMEKSVDYMVHEFAAVRTGKASPALVENVDVQRLAAAPELCVCDLTAAFELSQPTISHHLKILREAGLVDSSRRGTWAYYRLVPEALEALRGALAA